MSTDFSGPPGRPIDPVFEELKRAIEKRRPQSIEEANRIAAEISG
jgi:hypothetical protein